MKIKFSLVLLLLFQVIILGNQSDIKVISSGSNSIVIEFTPNYTSISDFAFNNLSFKKIDIKYGLLPNSENLGEPAIQSRYINLAVPNEFGNTIQILNTEYEIIEGKISPVIGSSFEKSSSQIDENYGSFIENDNLVDFGDFGNVRGLLTQTLSLNPIKYLANENKIKLYKKIVFRVNFSSNVNISFNEDKNLESIVVNYEQAKSWNKPNFSLSKVATNSPLNSGVWFKIEIKEEGIYKLDQTALKNMGIDVNSIDPRTIKIFNNGGYQLPKDPDADRPNNLVENSIFIAGESDGKFDNSDYVLFYGRGVNFWEYDVSSLKILRNRHYFSASNYYFLTFGGVVGKRMSYEGEGGSTGSFDQTTSKSFSYFEENKVNLLKSGSMTFGDEFNSSTKSRTYLTGLNNRVETKPIIYRFQVVNFYTSAVTLKVSEGETVLFNKALNGATGWYSDGELHSGSGSYVGSLTDNRSALNFNFNITNASAKAYLDYFEIEYEKYLKAVSDELLFFSEDTAEKVNYKLSNFSNSDIRVFDITDFKDVKLINSEISAGDVNFSKNETAGKISKYLALCSTKFKVPSVITNVSNSNVLGITEGAEYVIISNKIFSEQAQKYLEYRKSSAPVPISSELVFVEDIFNEFNSGLLDPNAIRDFLKYAFTNWQTAPFYVLFFGDGDYDYFNLEGYNTNFIPTYQTEGSLNEVYSYPSDDYYGRIVGGLTDKKVDLAIGRLPVRTTFEADLIFNKVKSYETESEKGLWRNNITLVADDGLTLTGNDGNMHTKQSERLAIDYVPAFFDLNKIYLSAYPTIITGLGRRKPSVTDAIVNAVNNGTLILNYIGHGNPDVWAHEYVFERATTIPLFKNDKYFFLTAATCDFGKYDDPALQSATEDMLFMTNAGMIGGFSAVRPVVSGENAALNNLFYSFLFEEVGVSSLPNTLGRAYWQTKQTRYFENDEKFHLFADPYLRLAQPSLPVKIDSVNGNDVTVITELNALGKAKISGTVVNIDNTQLSSYNGEGILSVFDSEKSVYLSDISYSMLLQGGVIFRGRVTIQNGKFSTEFTVPKDISYEDKNGKAVIYVFNEESDGIGFTKSIKIGGTDTTNIDDKKGPEIEIYFDDMNFSNSKLVNNDFTLLVNLFDETGLNTTGTGVGHKLEGIINDDEQNPVDLTKFFIGDLDSGGKSGLISYKFTNQQEGDYKLGIKAWDVFNNSAFQETYFTVVNGGDLTISDVVNYPNPFSQFTTFTFQHNLNSTVNVTIKIYTIAGRLIKEIEEKDILDRFVKINWDGKDEDFNRIGSGTYLYKLIVESTDGTYKESILGKLAVIK